MKYNQVLVANIYEFNNRYLLDNHTIKHNYYRKENYAVSAEMSLFWNGDNKLILLPEIPDPYFVEDVIYTLKYQNIAFIAPSKSTGLLCSDFLEDPLKIEIINSFIDSEVSFHPWGVTHTFYDLVAALSVGKTQSLTFPSREKYWVDIFLDSKIGARAVFSEIFKKTNELISPNGVILPTLKDAIDASRDLIQTFGKIVLKTNFGDAGKGVLVVEGIEDIHLHISKLSSDDIFWAFSPIIVEEFIEDADKSSFTVDGWISTTGQVLLKGAGKMLIRNAKNYTGVVMGIDVLSNEVEKALLQIGHKVGSYIADLGYRGWFDVDVIVGKDNRIYGTEINARRTGPTHVIDIAEHIFGSEWAQKATFISCERIYLNRRYNSYSQIRDFFRSFHDKISKHRCGLIPVFTRSISLELPYVGYVIYGHSLREVIALKEEFDSIIGVIRF